MCVLFQGVPVKCTATPGKVPEGAASALLTQGNFSSLRAHWHLWAQPFSPGAGDKLRSGGQAEDGEPPQPQGAGTSMLPSIQSSVWDSLGVSLWGCGPSQASCWFFWEFPSQLTFLAAHRGVIQAQPSHHHKGIKCSSSSEDNCEEKCIKDIEMPGYEGYVNTYWERQKSTCNCELIEKEVDISKENKISTALIRSRKIKVFFKFIWNHESLGNSFQHDFLCFFLSVQSGPVGEGTEPGGLGITSTLAILIFLSLMTASRSNVYYSIPHISVYSPWKNTVTNHQGQHGVQTCDKPGFISCLCHLSVSFIVLRAAQAHHCFAFWLVWLILSLQKNKGWRRIAPLLPSSVLSSNFTWHLLNNVFPFTSLLPFVFFRTAPEG